MTTGRINQVAIPSGRSLWHLTQSTGTSLRPRARPTRGQGRHSPFSLSVRPCSVGQSASERPPTYPRVGGGLAQPPFFATSFSLLPRAISSMLTQTTLTRVPRKHVARHVSEGTLAFRLSLQYFWSMTILHN